MATKSECNAHFRSKLKAKFIFIRSHNLLDFALNKDKEKKILLCAWWKANAS